jgi:hypothetical protein
MKLLTRILATVVTATVLTASALAQSAQDLRGRTPVVENQPPAQLIVDPPNPQALGVGVVLIQYQAKNVHIVPVFGPAALKVFPRVGHVHINVDNLPWHWADANDTSTIDIKDLPQASTRCGLTWWTAIISSFPGSPKL